MSDSHNVYYGTYDYPQCDPRSFDHASTIVTGLPLSKAIAFRR